MKIYVDKDKLQEFTTKLTAKFKTIFALKGETATDEQVTTAVSAWLNENVDPVGSAVVVDSSLSVAGAAADAKKTGDEISQLKSQTNAIFPDAEITTAFLVGKYYDANLELQDNNSSVYAEGIPCKGYSKVIISTPNKLVSNSTRCMGLRKNGVSYSVYTIQSLVSRCTQVGDHYETWIDVGAGDTFYMSIQSANTPISVKLTPAISSKLLETIKPTTLYVDSVNGNDENVGNTRDAALASIQKAIDLGGKTILVKEGSYAPFSMLEKNDVLISIDPYYSAYTAGTDEDDPKIIIDGTGIDTKIGVEMNRCNRCVIKNIEAKNFTSMGFRVYRCSDCRYIDCVAHDIGLSGSESVRNGYTIQYSDADFENCIAYNIGTTGAGAGSAHYDGFNVHYTGTVNFINCSAWNCEDDGVSHHDACMGYIDGGEWYNCGKAGISSPTHGAKVNVLNVYCHDNDVGIYADNTIAVTPRGNIIFSNCVCVDNESYDLVIGDYYSAIAVNCVYNSVSGETNITRFGIT